MPANMINDLDFLRNVANVWKKDQELDFIEFAKHRTHHLTSSIRRVRGFDMLVHSR